MGCTLTPLTPPISYNVPEEEKRNDSNRTAHLSIASSSAFSQACPPCRSCPLSPRGPARLARPFQRAGGGIRPVGKKRPIEGKREKTGPIRALNRVIPSQTRHKM